MKVFAILAAAVAAVSGSVIVPNGYAGVGVAGVGHAGIAQPIVAQRQYAVPPPREIQEAPIVQEVLTPVRQYGWKVWY